MRRSKWLTNQSPLPANSESSSDYKNKSSCSKIIEVIIDEDAEEDKVDEESDEELNAEDLLHDSSSNTSDEEFGSEMSKSTTTIARFDSRRDFDTQPLGDMRVLNVSLWPPELERGCWPADYKLSDHGLVECVFQVALTPRPSTAEK